MYVLYYGLDIQGTGSTKRFVDSRNTIDYINFTGVLKYFASYECVYIGLLRIRLFIRPSLFNFYFLLFTCSVPCCAAT